MLAQYNHGSLKAENFLFWCQSDAAEDVRGLYPPFWGLKMNEGCLRNLREAPSLQSEEMGPQSYNCMQLNLTNNLNELGSIFNPEFEKNSSTDTLYFST